MRPITDLISHVKKAPLSPDLDSFTMRNEHARKDFIQAYDKWYRQLQQLLLNDESQVTDWNIKYTSRCKSFCDNMGISNRTRHFLMRLAGLKRDQEKGIGELYAIGFQGHPVPYPNFIETLEQIVSGKKVVGQLGTKSRALLSVALIEYYKGERIG